MLLVLLLRWTCGQCDTWDDGEAEPDDFVHHTTFRAAVKIVACRPHKSRARRSRRARGGSHAVSAGNEGAPHDQPPLGLQARLFWVRSTDWRACVLVSSHCSRVMQT